MMEASSSDTQLLLQQINRSDRRKYGYINTVWVASCLLMILVALGVLVVLTPFIWPAAVNFGGKCYALGIYVYFQCALWLFVQLYSYYISKKHIDSRIAGFLKFHRNIYSFTVAPAEIVSQFALLTLLYIPLIYQSEDPASQFVVAVDIFLAVEIVSISIFLITYIVRVRAFNKEKRLPDAFKNSWVETISREILYNSKWDDWRLLERQADYMCHLKDQNECLIEKVASLTFKLEEAKKNLPRTA